MKADDAQRQATALLLQWCDALVCLQVSQPDSKRLDGGILCPACGVIHGRCHEAVYPLLCAAGLTGSELYLNAAKRLFAWGENMRCEDGGFRNDFKSDWKGVTVFAAIALHDALYFHGDLLSEPEKRAWMSRLSEMGAWLYRHLTEQSKAYLNYHAANACAMALLGTAFSNDSYIALAKRLAAYCLAHVTENGLLYGEGSPVDGCSPKGCRAIDLGYNAEETLPCLTRCAEVIGDSEMLEQCRALWRVHLSWMLPDGAWDDSTGTRAFKWTYWGSRTADGCQAALFSLGRQEPRFAEAAWRNFELYRRCTVDGLLSGGPDYALNGEPTCVHHTFCHAKVLALSIDCGIPSFERTKLHCGRSAAVKHFSELDTDRAVCGKWRIDVSGYDFSYSGSRHASGGCISLFWHEDAGPLIAVGMLDQTLREPHNQQISVHPERCRSGCPGVEALLEGTVYRQQNCSFARLSSQLTPDCVVIYVEGSLCDQDGKRMPETDSYKLEYRLTEDHLVISGKVDAALSERSCFVLPLIGEKADVTVLAGALICPPVQMFNLCPGFLGKEFRIRPDASGKFIIRLAIKSSNSKQEATA